MADPARLRSNRRAAPAVPAWGARAAALVAMALTAPVAGIGAIALLVVLGRPLLFRQERAGHLGRPFTLLKLRTMREERDATGRLMPDRARTPPTAALVRRLRIDEWPQLWAIARGDMAWIGPRPLLPDTVRRAGEIGRRRGLVRPGLTGLAQVSGNTRLDESAKLALDVWYVAHRSWRLDLAILLATARTLVGGERVDPARAAMAKAFVRRSLEPTVGAGSAGDAERL